MKQGTAEWLEWRRKHVGASDQTHLQWCAPWSLGWKGLWEIKTGRRTEQTQNAHMKRGVKLEDEARLAYSMEREKEFHPVLIESQEYPYLSASLDARSDDGEIAEIKCAGAKDHALAIGGTIPRKYLPQLCHQLFVSGASFVDYVSFDGIDLAVVRYPRDEPLIERVVERATLFWGFVDRNDCPPEEFPLPDFDTRVPIIKNTTLEIEAERNLSFRENIERYETLLETSNQFILANCDSTRCKIGSLQIVTRKGVRSIQKARD
jgi:putative phage-type endonuclease